MHSNKEIYALVYTFAMAFAIGFVHSGAQAKPLPQQTLPQSTTKQTVGAIQGIQGNTITLKPDAAPSVAVTVQDSVRILRVAPGQTDLKNASAIQLADLQVGDRILVRGVTPADGHSIVAATIIAMKRSDVEAKQQQQREDWQKRGIGGLVSSVDAASGTVTISAAALGGASRAIAIHAGKDTLIRRYAPDSVQFDDAKPSSLADIKPGDQLRARGSADGGEFSAEEIVCGAFRNISGTIRDLDAGANTLTVMDLATKKPVSVKVSAQSLVLKLPPQTAQGIAFQMKGGARGAAGEGQGAESRHQSENPPAGESGDSRPARRSADFQQVLNRLPKSSLADLQKGDAVMIVSTEGTASGSVTAITLLVGVEPILQASPSGAQSMTLSPWNIGGAGDQGGDAP